MEGGEWHARKRGPGWHVAGGVANGERWKLVTFESNFRIPNLSQTFTLPNF